MNVPTYSYGAYRDFTKLIIWDHCIEEIKKSGQAHQNIWITRRENKACVS